MKINIADTFLVEQMVLERRGSIKAIFTWNLIDHKRIELAFMGQLGLKGVEKAFDKVKCNLLLVNLR